MSGANTHTYGEETVGKLQQEELVWKSEREQYKDKMYELDEDGDDTEPPHEVAVGKNGINEDDDNYLMSQKPKAKGD